MLTKQYLCLLVIGLIFYGCTSVDPIDAPPLFEFKVFNQANMDIELVNDKTGERTLIKDGEFETINSDQNIFSHTIEPVTPTDKTIERKEKQFRSTGNTYYEVVAYEDKLRYEISGTASTVDITYTNSSGGTSQFSDISLPYTIKYGVISTDFAYISAQNNGESGTVNVRVYYEDRYKDGASSVGAFVIATASASLD